MFSRTALARAFALPLEQSTRSSITTTCLRQAYSTTTSTTTTTQQHPHPQPTAPNPNPTAPLSATPRAAPAQRQPTAPKPQHKSRAPAPAPTKPFIPIEKRPVAPSFTSPLKITQSLASALPNLTTQTPHYITAHLHANPYLLTAGDQLRLPFLMPKVKAGDILRLNRASLIGSRDFTLKGTPYLDERMFECRVRITGFESEPLRVKEKTKRRQRHVQKITSKHRYTIMRVMEVKVKSVEELVAEGAVVVEDGQAEGEVAVEVKA